MPRGIYKRTDAMRKNISNSLTGKKSNYSFPLGHTPWNKGMTIRLNSGKSHFKKGHKSWNSGIKGTWAKEKHYNWKGGVSRDTHSLSTPEYKEWRMNVFFRDNFKCRINNQDCKGQLQAHHILRWVDYPELRYEVNNGIALCIAHHPRKRAEEKRLSPYFMELVSVSKVQY